MRKYFLAYIIILLAATGVRAQNYYRLRTDMTIKKKNFDGTYSLTKGTVYYDNITGKLVMDLWFPHKETYVMYKNMVYVFKDGKFVQAYQNPAPPETTIFALVLKNNLKYYGLEKSGYTLTDIEEDDGLVISTWLPPKQFRNAAGRLMIANKDGLITGIVFFSSENPDKVVSKQFFENYREINGLYFPTKMVQLLYDKQGNESIQQTEFENIVIDEKDNDRFYDFPIERYLQGDGANR